MSMIPERIMEAIHFAEFVMAKEKQDRIGRSEAAVYPMKFFFFYEPKEITGLIGSPFHHPELDDKDVMALVVRLFAVVLDAQAVLHVTEGWIASRCAACGGSITETRDGRCGICGTEMVLPSKNPYREEMLIATLSLRGSEKAYFWTSRFDRAADGTILGFHDRMTCEPMEAGGRFMQVWELEPWMGPHFAVNLPVILHALGREVSKEAAEIARATEQMAPPNYPFVRLGVGDVASVLRRMKLREN
ncbi:MAG: hypothetical protein V2A79_12985 [Planctomycetota bacterium]